MALRLRRDVQKASYYVWFLGAEEARGLRGPRVINPVVPYLIERSRDQEPLKVTLQVSHKGIKILQGQSKHFIPHSAITSSVQIDDIVACVLLLYNPATKCPLHVHAYRCDSETTAEALHQQLQILINRPENQKRFADLESRLGITQNSLGSNAVEQKRFPPRRTESSSSSSPKRFESSLGSDTGTSTRESECSEENTSSSPMSPVHKQKGDLFDSLAAELRAKLNGNGPPLLLPPRDYDTVHRSKGNLAAIELRRCRNSLIVGATTGPAKQVSSRGSSGIGSDLAPSPERQDDHSSSEEDNWSNDAENSVVALKTNQVEPPMDKRRHEENYLRDLPVRDYPRSTSRGRESFKNNAQVWSVEDEIRPIIMRTPDYDARFKRVLVDKHYNDERITDMEEPAQVNRTEDEPIPQGRRFCKYPDETDHKKVDKLEKSLHNKLSLHQRQQYDRYDYDFDTEEEDFHQHENLTDRQKYQEAYSKKGKTRQIQSYERPKYPDEEGPIDTSTKLQRRYHFSPERHRQQQPPPHEVYRAPVQGGKDNLKYNEKNPYKKPDSLPYRESIERMMKSPVMRYKSFDNNQARPDYENNHVAPRPNFRNHSYSVQEKRSLGETDRYDGDSHFTNNKRQVNNSSPDSTNTSPKDRFHDAKEKFRAMEKIKLSTERNKLKPHGPKELHRRGSLEPPDVVDVRYENNWSDEDQCVTSREQRGGIIRREYRKNEKRPEDVYPGISNSKSLSNLAKGYRHSYAEPRPSLPRNSGRVGLAAVNPF